MSSFVGWYVAPAACPVWKRDNTMVLIIVAQTTNALVRAISMTNMTDYPHLHALCRTYLQSVFASLDLIVFHRAGHNGRHACVLDMALRLTFDLTVPVAVVRGVINAGGRAHSI